MEAFLSTLLGAAAQPCIHQGRTAAQPWMVVLPFRNPAYGILLLLACVAHVLKNGPPRGSSEERLHVAFQLFDADKDGKAPCGSGAVGHTEHITAGAVGHSVMTGRVLHVRMAAWGHGAYGDTSGCTGTASGRFI